MARKGTKVIIYSDTDTVSFYRKTLQYLHDKYHNHPSALSDEPWSAEDKERLSNNDSHGRHAARHAHANRPTMVQTAAGERPWNDGKDVA